MQDRLEEVARLGKVVGHMRGVALDHGKRGNGVPGDLLLRAAKLLHERGNQVNTTQRHCSIETTEHGAMPWPSTRLDGHGGLLRGKCSVVPHWWITARRIDSNHELTTRASWVLG